MKRGGARNQGSRGQSPPYTGRYINRHNHAGTNSNDASLAHESGPSKWERRKSEGPVSGVTNQFKSMSTSDYPSSSAPHGVGKISPNIETSRLVQSVPLTEGQTPKQMESRSFRDPTHDDYFNSLSTPSSSNVKSVESIQSLSGGAKNWTPPIYLTYSKNESSLSASPEFQDGQFSKKVQSGKSAYGGSSEEGDLENSDGQHKAYSYDICLKSTGNVPKLKSSLLTKNREKRNEMKRQERGEDIKILRPGMVLLKGYIHLMDQVKLVKSCRDLGKGCGGFYQPGYRDGAKLNLKMMCLGKNWDPVTHSYGDKRPVDGSIPPSVPDDFQQIVKRAIQESHDYLKSHSIVRNLEDSLPSMSPNICIVNFYTNTGKLGLHQDKDESPESLHKELPVVSFSIGDSAEFLYGDERDIDKAEKVVLKSGDVLIFGGKSRLIFHGVSSIIPETAPKALKEETNLRPGRLNLTFREY